MRIRPKKKMRERSHKKKINKQVIAPIEIKNKKEKQKIDNIDTEIRKYTKK